MIKKPKEKLMRLMKKKKKHFKRKMKRAKQVTLSFIFCSVFKFVHIKWAHAYERTQAHSSLVKMDG